MKPRSVSCTPGSLRPMSSMFGARPAATSTTSAFSSFFSPPASTVIDTESLPTFTFEILAPVRTSIFRFLKARSTSLEQSASSTGRMFGITSTSVTCEPNAVKTSANSQPTAPAPTMTIDFGAFSRISASSDEMTVFLFSSSPICGRPFTREPVEMTTAFFASCFSSLPSAVFTRPRSCRRASPCP